VPQVDLFLLRNPFLLWNHVTDSRNRLDVVGVVPVSQWSLPAEARPSRITTAYTMDNNGGTVDPITLSPTNTPCAAQAVVLAKTGCVLYDEQMENGGFELCANQYWGFFDPATGYYISLDTMPLNRTAMGPYGFQSDEVHSGQNAMRIVFKDEMKDTSIRLYSQNAINACVERSYTWSFWAKQGSNNACTVEFNYGEISRGIFTPGSQWTKYEGRVNVSPEGNVFEGGSIGLFVNCVTGGMDSRVLLDDISFRQINSDSGSPEPDTSSKTSYTAVATPTPAPQTSSASAVTASSTPTVDSFSSLVASITSAPSSFASPTTPSSCTPTIIDGGFANFAQARTDGYGTSDDWSYSRDFYTQENGRFWANAGYGPAYSGDVTTDYTAFTDNAVDAFYDIKYKHPISLCAGTSYDISGWMRIHRRNSVYSEGCRVTAMLNGQQAFSDRLGYHDWNYRYVHGTITPATDVTDAELYFRVTCRSPQISGSSAPRGIKLDEVAVVPVSQWTLPDAASTPTRTTSIRTDTTPTQIFPNAVACQPTDIVTANRGCVLYDEQILDPGFEICSYSNWVYAPAGNRNDYESPLATNKQLTQLVTDEKHSGDQSLRIVFNSTGGSAGIFRAGAVNPCVERSYVYSFWGKQATANACTVDYYWGEVLRGSLTPPVGSWGKWEGRVDLSPIGQGIQYSGYIEVRVNCPNAGGLANAVWLDDVSHQQVPYTGPA
jgi:hypothetical protein